MRINKKNNLQSIEWISCLFDWLFFVCKVIKKFLQRKKLIKIKCKIVLKICFYNSYLSLFMLNLNFGDFTTMQVTGPYSLPSEYSKSFNNFLLNFDSLKGDYYICLSFPGEGV